MYKLITFVSFLALVSCNDLANKVDSQKQANLKAKLISQLKKSQH